MKHLGRTVQDLRESAEVPKKTPPEKLIRERYRAVHETCQDNNASETSDKEMNMVRKRLFNFHSVKLFIITKL